MKQVLDKREVQLKSIHRLKDKGVTAIKVELEAQLDRFTHDDETTTCDECINGRVMCSDCDGAGSEECHYCEGSGTITEATIRGEPTSHDCQNCEGSGNVSCSYCSDGTVTCEECDGEGNVEADEWNTWGSEEYCFEWLMNRVAELTNTALTSIGGDYEATNPFNWMKYAKFYNDGSVDSEITFTVKLDTPENAFYIPQVLQAFKDMAEAMGAELNVAGAGLHTALIWSEDASYPSRADDDRVRDNSDSHRLPEQSLKNFKRAMTQLLPALYFLGTQNDQSRGLRYRNPHVSVNYHLDANYGRYSKYSAISYRMGAMEFRVFDTCYDTPEAIMDNIVVIANSLRYLSERYVSPNLDKITPVLNFGNDVDNTLERFYGSATHLDVLNAGLSRLKPSYYTVSQLKAQRSFKRTKTTLKTIRKQREAKAKIAYEEYKERFELEEAAVRLEAKGSYLRSFVQRQAIADLRTMTPEEMEAQAQTNAESYVESWIQNNYRTANRFIGNLVETMGSNDSGHYTLEFN